MSPKGPTRGCHFGYHSLVWGESEEKGFIWKGEVRGWEQVTEPSQATSIKLVQQGACQNCGKVFERTI